VGDRVTVSTHSDQYDTSDRIRRVLDSLVQERQELRRRNTDPAALEANRLAIVYWQQELSKRLIKPAAVHPESLAPRARDLKKLLVRVSDDLQRHARTSR
jgi:hypothetical protein